MTKRPSFTRHAGDVELGRCSKPKCSLGDGLIQRHHKGHEKFWITQWNTPGMLFHETITKSFRKEFTDRYNAFRKEDVVEVCAFHHAEIHLIYRRIMRDEQISQYHAGVYSAEQVKQFTTLLRQACTRWLKYKSHGADPELVFGGKVFL